MGRSDPAVMMDDEGTPAYTCLAGRDGIEDQIEMPSIRESQKRSEGKS